MTAKHCLASTAAHSAPRRCPSSTISRSATCWTSPAKRRALPRPSCTRCSWPCSLRTDGSLCIRLNAGSLTARLAGFLPPTDAQAWSERILAWWKLSPPRALLADGDDPAPLTGERFRPLVRATVDGADAVYFHKYYTHEQTLRLLLRQRAANETALPVLTDLKAALADVLDANPLLHQGQPVELNADQKRAVAMAFLGNLLVVSGGPGTGKTSIIFTLLRCLLRLRIDPDRVRLAAPTGRAAQRITDFLRSGLASLARQAPADAPLANVSASTVHRLLGYSSARGTFEFDQTNPVPADVVIVDEVSMVDVELMLRLLAAVEADAKIILLGDKDQLPSVEAGAVLANLLPADAAETYSLPFLDAMSALGLLPPSSQIENRKSKITNHIVLLRHNYRSQRHIQDVSAAVNAGNCAIVDELPVHHLKPIRPGAASLRWPKLADLKIPGGDVPGGVWLIDPAVQSWRQTLRAWATDHYLSSAAGGYAALVERCKRIRSEDILSSAELTQLGGLLNRFRVLTLVREGRFGSAGVNEYLAEILAPRLDRGWRSRFFAGALVMVTTNDHVRQIYNGDVGIVLRDDSGGYRAFFPRGGSFLAYPLDALPQHELAFAITVHKAQGSEYQQVLLALGEDPAQPLLTREIIYTAITRAKDLAAIYGKGEILKTAIARRIQREMGAELWG